MFFWGDKNQKLKAHALKMKPKGQLKNYLMTPLLDKNLAVQDLNYLILDFETTGLDDKKDHILSMGFTEICNNRIQLKSSQHHLVKTDRKLASANVSIHQITDDAIINGIEISAMMNLLLQHLAGKVLVAHYQRIEYNFIQNICQKLYGHLIPLQMVDTLQIEKRHLDRMHRTIQPNQLRLANLRAQYNLPRYHAHNAMEDAIATAELFLAQISHRQINGYQLKLKDILS